MATVELLCFARIRANKAPGSSPFRRCMDLAASGGLWGYLDAQLAAYRDACECTDVSQGEIHLLAKCWFQSWVSASAAGVSSV